MRWKDVDGFEDYFSVSENGDVFSKRTNRYLKQNFLNEYLGFVTRIGGRDAKCTTFKTHILVAKAFVHNPEPDSKKFVNHIKRH